MHTHCIHTSDSELQAAEAGDCSLGMRAAQHQQHTHKPLDIQLLWGADHSLGMHVAHHQCLIRLKSLTLGSCCTENGVIPALICFYAVLFSVNWTLEKVYTSMTAALLGEARCLEN